MSYEFEDEVNVATEAPRQAREERGNVRGYTQSDEAPRQPREDRSAYQSRDRDNRDNRPAQVGLNLSQLAGMQMRTSIGGISDAAMQTITSVFESAKDHETVNIPMQVRRNQFKTVPITGHASGQDPALLVSLSLQHDNLPHTLVYVLLLEQPDAVQQTRTLTEGREQFDALITPEDQMNNRMHARIEAAFPNTEIVIVNYQVVLSELTRVLANSSEVNNKVTGLVASIMNNAIDALSGTRERIIAEMSGLSVTDVSLNPTSAQGGVRMEVLYDYPVVIEKDGSGLPTPADVVGRVYFSNPRKDEYDQDQVDRQFLGSVSATLDLYLDEGRDDDNSRYGLMSRRDNAPQPFWQGVLDVRGLTGNPHFPFSLEQSIYQLAQITPLTNSHRWIRALTPRNAAANQTGVTNSLVDLGWLNYYNPNPEQAAYVEDITANTPEEVLVDYLASVVRPDIAVGMTLPNSNDKSWILSIFEYIASAESLERQDLVSKLYRSINVLTGDRFLDIASNTALMDRDYTPIIATGVKELIGVWTDDKGNVRPLSEWNVAAFATKLGDKQNAEDMVREYQMTFEANSGYSVDWQLATRFDILRRWATGTARVVGTAEKHVFDTEFLSILSDAISGTSLDPFLTNADNLTRRQRAGHTVYRNHAASDLGHVGRRRDEGLAGRARSAYRGTRRY